MSWQASLFAPKDQPEQWKPTVVPQRPDERMVTTHDGRQVSNYSEEWRLDCEARYVLNMPTKAERRHYLHKVEKKRGPAGRKYLEDYLYTMVENIRARQKREREAHR